MEGIERNRSTLQRTLKKEGLKRCRLRKTHLLIARNLRARLYFARKYIDKETSFWSSVLWSDETKIKFFRQRNVSFVWRKKSEAFKPKNTIQPLKYGGRGLMFWCFFSMNGTRRLLRVEGIMKRNQCVKKREFEKVYRSSRYGIRYDFST